MLQLVLELKFDGAWVSRSGYFVSIYPASKLIRVFVAVIEPVTLSAGFVGSLNDRSIAGLRPVGTVNPYQFRRWNVQGVFHKD